MERQVLPHEQPPLGATHAEATAELNFRAQARGKPPQHFADFDPQQRREAVAAAGMRPVRADQVARHYCGRFEAEPSQMTDLGQADQERARGLLPELITPVVTQVADKGWTRKTLWRLFDGAQVESVLMRYPKRVTLCVSSQVGCGMGCPFCATGQLGLTRNLGACEPDSAQSHAGEYLGCVPAACHGRIRRDFAASWNQHYVAGYARLGY